MSIGVAMATTVEGASIRPRPFSRGNKALDYFQVGFGSASIRPRPFSRGNVHNTAVPSLVGGASIRPRPFSRGDTRHRVFNAIIFLG